MRTKIQWAELHAPLFLAGVNLGQKIPSAKHKSGFAMEYDEAKRHLYVTYNNATARIPETSVLSMVEAKDGGVITTDNLIDHIASVAAKAMEAQVETPTSHVFAGPGKGQTGRGGRK